MLKNKLNIITPFIVILLIISLTSITAFAGQLPDLSNKGILRISMKEDGKAVGGGEFEIYHIADMVLSKGKIKYVFTKDFKSCGFSLDDIESDSVTYELEGYIADNEISGIRENVDDNGIAEFSNLKPGIYFVIQNETAKGYIPVNSFTVTLPYYDRGKYNYTVTANPKLISNRFDNNDFTTTVKSPNSPDSSDSHDGSDSNDSTGGNKPTDSQLPITGQLNLPIPILTVSGFCMLILGLVIRIRGRKEDVKK